MFSLQFGLIQCHFLPFWAGHRNITSQVLLVFFSWYLRSAMQPWVARNWSALSLWKYQKNILSSKWLILLGSYPIRIPWYPGLVGGLEHLDYFSIQLGISSSQLANSIIFQRGGSTTNPNSIWRGDADIMGIGEPNAIVPIPRVRGLWIGYTLW